MKLCRGSAVENASVERKKNMNGEDEGSVKTSLL